MKKWLVFLWIVAWAVAGCTRQIPVFQSSAGKAEGQKTEKQEQSTVAALMRIWAEYEEEERFAVYGGIPAQPVRDGAGALSMREKEKWAAQFHIPETDGVEQGASLSHLLSQRLFTCTVFRVTDTEKMQPLAASWRQGLQESVWVSGPPERMLLVKLRPGYLLLAYGSKEQMERLREKTRCAYPKARVLYSEPFMSRGKGWR